MNPAYERSDGAAAGTAADGPRSTMHVCHEGGWLVAGRDWFGTHPSDFDWYANYSRVGCNALRCARCGEGVVQRPGWRIHGGSAPPAGALLCDSADWSGIPAMVHDVDGRTYACRCVATSVLAARSMQTEDERGPELPWRCGGHAPLGLPSVLDGVQLPADVGALGALAVDALARRIPASAPWPATPDATAHPAMWWARLFAMLADDAAREAVGRGAAACLSASDPALRHGAVDFFWLLPFAPGAEALASVMTMDLGSYDGVACEPARDLGYFLRRALSARIDLDGAWGGPADMGACSAAAQDLLNGRGAMSFVFALGRRDPAWLAQNVAAIAGRHPDFVGTILTVFATAPEPILTDVVRRLVAGNVASDALQTAAKKLGGAVRGVVEAVLRASGGTTA